MSEIIDRPKSEVERICFDESRRYNIDFSELKSIVEAKIFVIEFCVKQKISIEIVEEIAHVVAYYKYCCQEFGQKTADEMNVADYGNITLKFNDKSMTLNDFFETINN
ncbi:MAG: hypothetical protein LBM67_08385 [Lentimicrobiaceae bacterium]|jgi:hypothetical protein|nr:hypothetical protein [Lentimicrobiaceae bacterium]